jgi:hypothetical protein
VILSPVPTTLTSLVKQLHLYKAVYATHGLLCAKNYCDGMGVKGKDRLALLPDGPLLFTHQILLELKQGIGHSLPHTPQGERDTSNLVTNKDTVNWARITRSWFDSEQVETYMVCDDFGFNQSRSKQYGAVSMETASHTC